MAKQFLDSTGLNTLWGKITAGFAPTWKAVDISKITATPNSTNIVLGFSTTGADPSNTEASVITGNLTLPTATTSLAGMLSAADKQKIDNMSTSISGSIKFDGLKVNGSALKLTNKIADFNLVYNATTDTLDIVDKNDNNAVKTSVSVNSFIGDAVLNGVLSSAEIVNKNASNTAGTFLKLVFTITKNDGTTDSSTIYANVADLVSTYTAGTGIEITTSNTDIDNTASKATITLKKATASVIGGIKVGKVFTTDPTVQTATTATNRYFPIELTTGGLAVVNIPASELAIGTATAASGGTLSHGGTFTAITALTETYNENTGTTLVPTLTTYKLPAVPTFTVGANTTASGGTLSHGGTFTAITAIAVNGHGIKYTPTTFTLPNPTLTTGTDGTNQTTTLIPGKANSVKVLETITVSGHTITRDPVTINVDDPESIPNATIEALAYPA